VIWLERVMRRFVDDTKIYAGSRKEVTMIQLADPIIKHRIVIREDD
jgi:hypothetical protein